MKLFDTQRVKQQGWTFLELFIIVSVVVLARGITVLLWEAFSAEPAYGQAAHPIINRGVLAYLIGVPLIGVLMRRLGEKARAWQIALCGFMYGFCMMGIIDR